MCVWNTMINDLPAWSQDTAQQPLHLGSACYCQVVWFPPPRPQPLSHCIPRMPPRHTSSEPLSNKQIFYQFLKDDVLFILKPTNKVLHDQTETQLKFNFEHLSFRLDLTLQFHNVLHPQNVFHPFSLSWLWSGGVCGHQPRVSGVSDDPHTTARVRDQTRVWFRDTGPSHSIIQPTSHADTIWNKRGIIYSIPDLLWFIPWCCLEHGHDDNVHIYVYIISTTRTMSPASAPLHTYVLRAWLSWLLMRGERGEWLEGPPWGSSQQATHLTAKFRKLRDELQRGNKERGVETKTLCCHFMSLLNWFKYFFYLA